jgi:hypothetical protein
VNERVSKVTRLLTGSGCLLALAGPTLGIFLYPHTKWLFGFVLFGVAVVAFAKFYSKDPRPQELADEIEKLLNGTYNEWAVDDFEHWGIRESRLKDYWRRSMEICPRPEEWINLNEELKQQLRTIIEELRALDERDAIGSNPENS